MSDDDREFERIVRDGWGYSAASLPGADRFWPWAACPVVLALAAGAVVYPLLVPAHALMLEALAGAWEGIARAFAFLITGEPGVVDGSAPGWDGKLARTPLRLREELAAVFCAVVGAKLAGFVGAFVTPWTAACRGYEAGMRLTKLVAWFVALGALATVFFRGAS